MKAIPCEVKKGGKKKRRGKRKHLKIRDGKMTSLSWQFFALSITLCKNSLNDLKPLEMASLSNFRRQNRKRRPNYPHTTDNVI